MSDATLLAKSVSKGRQLTLIQHLTDTEEAATRIFEPRSRFASSWLRFFRLPETEFEKFLVNLRVASLLHDLGKANAHFQAAVRRTRTEPQTLRHEHLSALVLHLEPFRTWLSSCSDLDVEAITGAVLSHHLKAGEEGDYRWGQPRDVDHVRLFLTDEQVGALLGRLSVVAGLPKAPLLPAGDWNAGAPWAQALSNGVMSARRFRRSLPGDLVRRAMLLSLKAGVILADSVASALRREDLEQGEWLRSTIHIPQITADDVEDAVIRPRGEQLQAQFGTPFRFHPFQEAVAKQGRRLLLLAGCGMGKTIAAWKWASGVADAEPIGRVLFLYPTRGTATEGFRDYVGWAPEAERDLITGTARWELLQMAGNPPESFRGVAPDPDEQEDRLFALSHWNRRWVSATVDQFLGFMQHSYRSFCLLPLVVDGALIVDEIHSFSEPMFDAFVAFLKAFDGPVLCMTATLSQNRVETLRAAGLTIFPGDDHPEALEALRKSEGRPRYRLVETPEPGGLGSFVKEAYEAGQRILWVVNTVARCQARARNLAGHGLPVITYHSRYRLKDRVRRHREAVDAFGVLRPAVAVTTQVCEMSLDLDADMLVTEIAPPASLVQRFGRVNRHLRRGPDFRGRLVCYVPESTAPYSGVEVNAGKSFVTALGGGDLSQLDLAGTLLKHSPPESKVEGNAAFLEGGYYAIAGNLRGEDGFTVPAVLDVDAEEAVRDLRGRRPIDGLLLPAPTRLAKGGPPYPGLPSYLSVVPASNYSSEFGLMD